MKGQRTMLLQIIQGDRLLQVCSTCGFLSQEAQRLPLRPMGQEQGRVWQALG
jgi:hypothetical protein